MAKIEILDDHTIDKIAAGEVVERPASVVKELVENAIDAGATAITVEIAEGGKKLIRITDNGSGIEADQVRAAFYRHATSKIRKVEDLETIASLGFRGEALSSIASVACVELITKTPSSISGTRYLIEGGKEQKLEETGAPDGTTFLVRNLFFNTPARSKFLKSDVTEANTIGTLMEQLALSHPEISFKYIQNKQVRLHSSGNFSVKDVIYSIYGREITRSLIELSYSNDFLKIEGFIGKPEIARGNRSFENYYVNGRFVKNNIITKAIEDGYRGFLMQHKFPFVSLHIEMTGNELDVNVHPSKMEVRFARGAEVYETICEAVRKGLTHREFIPEVHPGKEPPVSVKPERPAPKVSSVPEPFENCRREEMLQEKPASYNVKPIPKEPAAAAPAAPADRPVLPEKKAPTASDQGKISRETNQKTVFDVSSAPAQKEEQISMFQEKMLSPESRSRHKLIGQLFDTYWLVQFEDHFYIIDQHAAHEKIYYERFVKQFREHTFHSQLLSPPLIVSLRMEEEQVLKANLETFHTFGFEIENFGGREYKISAVPSDLYFMREEELFHAILDHLEKEGSKSDPLEIFAMRLATMACKAAVKGNHSLSAREADHLIEELLSLDNPYHCPHGRPTIISMSKAEIEKKFKRIV